MNAASPGDGGDAQQAASEWWEQWQRHCAAWMTDPEIVKAMLVINQRMQQSAGTPPPQPAPQQASPYDAAAGNIHAALFPHALWAGSPLFAGGFPYGVSSFSTAESPARQPPGAATPSQPAAADAGRDVLERLERIADATTTILERLERRVGQLEQRLDAAPPAAPPPATGG